MTTRINNKAKSNNSYIELATETSHNSLNSYSSLPNLSIDDYNQVSQLKSELQELRCQLNIAQHEIEILLSEKYELSSKLETYEKKLKLFKSVGIDDLNLSNNSIKLMSTPIQKKTKLASSTKGQINIKQQGDRATTSQINLNERIQKQMLKTPIRSEEQITLERKISKDYSQSDKTLEIPDKGNKRKICILSTNNKNKLLKIAENTFPNYNICHYLTPNSGVKKLIENIDLKLKNYSMNDYCLIFIGEEDFKRTNDYVEITITIRETLLKVQHTNVIICAPTFKLNNYSVMFNGRIESFNSLLYLDACTYNYAYLFDSNFYLSYDYKMFWVRSGHANNEGLATIFFNIKLMINEFSINVNDGDCSEAYHRSLSFSKDENQGQQQFFLQ